MTERFWDIRVADASETSRFAAGEFARLIRAVDPECAAEVSESRFSPDVRALWIGRDPALPPPEVPDPEFDDAVRIEVAACAGSVTGNNARSVLLAVYRFFREAGCVFFGPGQDGEFVPRRDSAGLKVRVSECAAATAGCASKGRRVTKTSLN